MTDAGGVLRRTSLLGGFFAVDPSPGPDPHSARWQRFSELLAPSGREVQAGVERTRAALAGRSGLEPAAVDSRVAPSLWLLGWASRLVSPWFGAAVTTGSVPVAGVESLWWLAGAGQPVPLAVAEPAGETASAAEPALLASLVQDHCLRPFVEPLVAATAAAYSISGQVLWGNVASAVAGAATSLARVEPPNATTAFALAVELLETGPLRGAGAFATDRPGSPFRRNSCCLLYRVPGAGLCADCVLVGRVPS
jgi:ferric iron reductase protein FhuF